MDKEKAKSISTKKDHDHTGYVLELPLKKDILGKLFRALRKIRKYSQEKLGLLLGVKKAQISKLEKYDTNLTLSSIIKIFSALKTRVRLRIEFEKKKDLLTIKKALREELDAP